MPKMREKERKREREKERKNREKFSRIQWDGHLKRMVETELAKRIMESKSTGVRNKKKKKVNMDGWNK